MKPRKPLLMAVAAVCVVFVGGCALSSGPEPDDEELEAAVRQHFEKVVGNGTISNPINNVHMNLKEVRKLGCEPAQEGPGYFCTYTTRIALGATSNETSRDGIEHAQAANMFLKMMAGGDYGLVDENTHRFVRNWGHWELVQD